MTFSIDVSKKALKNIKLLSKSQYAKVYDILNILSIKAVPHELYDVKKLKGTGNFDSYRIRIGDFRIIYSIDWTKGHIKILRFERRGNAYK